MADDNARRAAESLGIEVFDVAEDAALARFIGDDEHNVNAGAVHDPGCFFIELRKALGGNGVAFVDYIAFRARSKSGDGKHQNERSENENCE